jgi:hypothetical protein
VWNLICNKKNVFFEETALRLLSQRPPPPPIHPKKWMPFENVGRVIAYPQNDWHTYCIINAISLIEYVVLRFFVENKVVENDKLSNMLHNVEHTTKTRNYKLSNTLLSSSLTNLTKPCHMSFLQLFFCKMSFDNLVFYSLVFDIETLRQVSMQGKGRIRN